MFFLWKQRRRFILKMVKRDVFLWKQSPNIIYPNKENMLMVPNNEKKGDYYVNLCLSNGKMNFNSKNGRKRCFSCEAKASIPFIPIRRMCLWYPIMKWKEIIKWICVYPNWKRNFSSKNCWKSSISYETKASIIYPSAENEFVVPNH